MASNKRAKQYHVAMAEAETYAAARRLPAVDPLDTLRALTGRIVLQLAHASMKADQLGEDEITVMTAFGPIDNEWIRAESRLRGELSKLCLDMARFGLAERMVDIQAARARLIERALVDAAIEAGIPRGKLRALGPAFRRNLRVLQGGGEEPAPAPSGRRRIAA
jgi:hypothetical protein